MSLLMVAVVILFAPALLGLVLLASRLEARVLDTPGNRPVRARKAPAAVTTADRPSRDQVA